MQANPQHWWRFLDSHDFVISKLVDGFNPFEKYARQMGSFAEVGVENKRYLKPPPRKSWIWWFFPKQFSPTVPNWQTGSKLPDQSFFRIQQKQLQATQISAKKLRSGKSSIPIHSPKIIRIYDWLCSLETITAIMQTPIFTPEYLWNLST